MLVIRVRQPIIDLIAQIVTKKHFHCSHFGKILRSVIVLIILAELLFVLRKEAKMFIFTHGGPQECS